MSTSKSFTDSSQQTTTQTLYGKSMLIGAGAKVEMVDAGAVSGAMAVAREVAKQAFSTQGEAFKLIDSANKQIASTGEVALAAVNQSKTDGGQTERLAKIGAIAAAVIAVAYMMLKR